MLNKTVKITTRRPYVKTESWYFSFEDAPEISFRGEMHRPTEVTVSAISNEEEPTRFYMEFVSPDTLMMGLYSSNEDAVFPFHSLPEDFLAAIFKECQ